MASANTMFSHTQNAHSKPTVFDADLDLDLGNHYEEEKNSLHRIRLDEVSEEHRKLLNLFNTKIKDLLNDDQRSVYDSILENIDLCSEYIPEFYHYDDNRKQNRNNVNILNAPAGSGKSYISLAIAIVINLKAGRSNASLIYAPTHDAVKSYREKITEISGYIYPEDKELQEELSKTVSRFLNINVNNHFYLSGSKAFSIHDAGVLDKITETVKKNKNDYQRIKNAVIATREAQIIMFDEAFFNTSNRLKAIQHFLKYGLIENSLDIEKFKDKFGPKFLNNLIYQKNILLIGDPCQLNVSVERQKPGQKYPLRGTPIWKINSGPYFLGELLLNMNTHNLYTLTKSMRFINDQNQDLISKIESIRTPYWKGVDGFDEWRKNLKLLLNEANKLGMIKFKQRPEDVASVIKRNNQNGKRTIAVTETKLTKKKINLALANDNVQKINLPQPEFMYRQGPTGYHTDLTFQDKLKSFENNDEKINFEQIYRDEMKKGCCYGKFMGPSYPSDTDENLVELFPGDPVRITFPLQNSDYGRPLKYMKSDGSFTYYPDNMKFKTGDFATAIKFTQEHGLIVVFDEKESISYRKESNIENYEVFIPELNMSTTNLVVSINVCDALKSEFFDHPIKEHRFKAFVKTIPCVKEGASTIHSVQGKTVENNTDVIYYMTSQLTKSLINEEEYVEKRTNEFKANRPMFLYTALTRSKCPSTNFKLYTEANNVSTLFKLITTGKTQSAVKEIHNFLEHFNQNTELSL